MQQLHPRQVRLIEEVRRVGSLSVEVLAERFGVTLQTVRRDVRLLTDAGLLARFHGGVRLPGSTTENIAYRQRQRLNDDAKRRIAKEVARAVPNGCSPPSIWPAASPTRRWCSPAGLAIRGTASRRNRTSSATP